MKLNHWPITNLVLLCLLVLGNARAELNIEITQGVEGAIPIAVIPFGWESASAYAPPQDIAQIISRDLRRSGRFAPLPEQDLLAQPHQGSQIKFKNWRILGTENLVVGRLRSPSPGNFLLEFQLFDVYTGAQLTGYSIPSTGDQLRFNAHRISDIIYKELTGQRGAFATKVAYVVENRINGLPQISLRVADADGYNPQTIVTSDQPIMSPSWSPDGTRLAYVSFESGRSAIYLQNVASGEREVVSNAKGHNGNPSWSPDGTRLALTREDRGNPDIYILNLGSRNMYQLTRSYAADIEPSWSPDGKSIVFTSDRGGRPQIYRRTMTGTQAERLTFDGKYNAKPSFSADGSLITFQTSNGHDRFRIATLEVESGLFRTLTEGTLDESPSFAPNGSMVIYATEGQGRGILAAVSTDGRVHQRLALQDGDVREPAWSPYVTNN